MSTFHPDLRDGRFIPPLSFGPRSTSLMQRMRSRTGPIPDDITARDVVIPGPAGAPDVPARIYRPRELAAPAPALLWLHGGGMIIGDHLQDERANIAIARELGMTVVSIDYRLAPQHPAPAALEDAFAALDWMFSHHAQLDIDADRIAVGGNSAGGGLAAGVTLMSLDRGAPMPAFQLLVYPMLDDRTVVRTDLDTSNVRVWTTKSNRYAWTAYLGLGPGHDAVSDYAAPGRRANLAGLPPTWIGVGTLDLFYEEDVDYARRLTEAEVPCELHVVPGAFHGFDVVMGTRGVSREFRAAQVGALGRGLLLAS